MSIFDRVKNILFTPAKEWQVIESETPDTKQIFLSYVVPLAALSAIAAFIGYALIGIQFLGYEVRGFNAGLQQALETFLISIGSVFLTAYVIDALAPSFESDKDFGRSFQLVAYSYTAGWIGGLLQVLPVIAFLGTLFGLYGLYIMYVGLPVLKHTPKEKHLTYFIVSIIVLIVAYIIIGFILSLILAPLYVSNMPVDEIYY